ncbi:hypothetical protein BP00DRAFT_341339, partial [Aspergillus indologenus CBS 114.80]
AHTTTGCGKQGFPSAQPYLSHTPGANPFCCMFLFLFLHAVHDPSICSLDPVQLLVDYSVIKMSGIYQGPTASGSLLITVRSAPSTETWLRNVMYQLAKTYLLL